MTNIIRLNANLQAPDFSKTKPPLNAKDYQIDCRDFESRQALEAEIRQRFSQTGAVLLINTGLEDLSKLDHWGNILIDEPMTYEGGTQPRPQISKNIYDVVGYEPHYIYIYPHNEMAYLPRFPQCLVFGCIAIPTKGGETLAFDNVAVTHEILQTRLGQKLKDKGVCYIRNLTDANAQNRVVYKHWQNVFGVDSREQIETIAQREAWDIKWMEKSRLNIFYQTDAYEYNELLGENLLFTPVGHHGMYFDDMSPLNTLPYEERPFHMTYGDGEPFTEKEIEFFVRIFDNHSLPIFWKPGWIAMLDNERWAHARPPFTLQAGESRKLGALLGIPKNRLGARF
jgi:alpha-ketoglutarate-dependent taurine dioxygenase